MGSIERPAWQLPQGVSRGTWDYVNDRAIANEYDRFHAGHPLLELDRSIIHSLMPATPWRVDGGRRLVIDIGCGTGRNLLPIATEGWNALGVDLSREMLHALARKSELAGLQDRCGLLRANMTQLDCIKERCADLVLCMYSSLGMVQGRCNRLSFLNHVRRILRPDGLFVVHVHNRGTWWLDPGGVRRALSEWWRSRWNSNWEFGDRVYPYRGLPSMFLHIYSERELREDFKKASLDLVHMHLLDRESSRAVGRQWLSYFRSGGFIAVCRKQSASIHSN